jgi:hypothetical protein
VGGNLQNMCFYNRVQKGILVFRPIIEEKKKEAKSQEETEQFVV